MPKWRKDFDKWSKGTTAVETSKAMPLLQRVFGQRLRIRQGSSHQFMIDVHELTSDPRFRFGHLMIPVSGGKKIKAPYLRSAYEAAVELKLYDPESSADND